MSAAGLFDAGADARTPFTAGTARTVPELLAECVAECPDRAALIASSAVADGEVTLTYAQLAVRSARLAGGLTEAGVRKGDRIGTLISNASAVEGHLAVHAAHRLGAVMVPINVRSTPADVDWCLESAGCTTLIYEGAQRPTVDALRESLAGIRLIALDGDADLVWADLAAYEQADQTPLAPEDPANWLFTSGTTGYPKMVAHSHLTAVACGMQVAEAWDLRAGDVYLNAHPFFTASGPNTSLTASLWARCTNVIEARFSPEESVARVERLKATTVMWMTPSLTLIMNAGLLDAADLRSVRRVLYGGQAMPTEFHVRVDDVLAKAHGVELVHMIGQSEAGPSGIILDPEHHRDRPGAVGNRGFSREHTEWAVLDEAGDEVGPGGEGELCYRGPSIMQCYVGSPEETAEVIRDGWLHSGDLVRLDEDGFAYFLDRTKDVIRRGGINIASAEIERAVRDCPGLADVAAVPHPHPVLGEVVRVVAVKAPGADVDEDAVIAYARERLADYKVPRVVSFVDELPRNDMGKVKKSLLRVTEAAPR